MNLKAIFRNVGFALLVNALFMLLSIFVSMANGNDSALAALMISFTLTFTVGIFPFIFVRKTTGISLSDGYMIIVLSWLLSFLFGMMPYLLWGGPFTVVNAWFESVSGFTTTGSTILDDIESLPKSLLFWRSSTHFIGGLGVVVFLMLVIPSSSPMRLRLANMELSSLSKEGYHSRTNKTVLIFTYLYLSLNLLCFLLYKLGGMSAFDAINHAFSAIATGGFSTRNASIQYYDSTYINIVSILMMFLASIHFAIMFICVVNRTLRPLKNHVLKTYSIITVIAILAVVVATKCTGLESSWKDAFVHSAFHVVSIVTTTGFDIASECRNSAFVCAIMLYLSLQCGMAGSTVGGLKIDRVILLCKACNKYIKNVLHPSNIYKIKMGNKVLRDSDVRPHLMFFVLYTVLVLFSIFFVSMAGDSEAAVSATIASIGNVGLGCNEIGAGGSCNSLTTATKLILTVDMLLGRLEIFPILALLSMLFSKKK